MNELRSDTKQEWAKKARARGKELLLDAMVLQNELFDQGDLTPYLNILSRMSYQNSRNLLLLMARFPNATYLAGFTSWQKLIPDPMARVLRPNQRGKGIELLVPFTVLNQNYITWFAVLHFDVSQININYDPPTGPYCPTASHHTTALLAALHSVAGESYHTSISVIEEQDELESLRAANLDCRMLPGFFLLRPNLSDTEKLKWLTTSLCRLYFRYNNLPEHYENYISLCACHCLLTIWGISESTRLVSNRTLVSSVPREDRQMILDQLQHCVHTVDAQISLSYEVYNRLEAELSAELEL